MIAADFCEKCVKAPSLDVSTLKISHLALTLQSNARIDSGLVWHHYQGFVFTYCRKCIQKYVRNLKKTTTTIYWYISTLLPRYFSLSSLFTVSDGSMTISSRFSLPQNSLYQSLILSHLDAVNFNCYKLLFQIYNLILNILTSSTV